MVKRKGLGQANILRTNNNTSTGYGVAYADEVSGHRTVGNLTALYALNDWQLSASEDNTNSDAVGQLWYVVDADGNGNGCYYQLKDWSKRKEAAGWSIADYTTKAELQDKIDNIATADEEDITTEGDTPQTQVLKLKDRTYDSLNASGKGYKILRKNWQQINGERKNVLTQDMINEPNTIYEIRYDFDLANQEIKILEGCTLNFQGGTISNGTIIGNNTNITANAIKIFNNNINIEGTYSCKARVEWFSNEDFQKTLDSFKSIILLPNKEYTINNTIVFPYNSTIEGEGNSVIKTNTNTPAFRLGYNSRLFNFIILVDNLSTVIRIDNENLELTYDNRDKNYSLVNSGISISNIHIKANYQYHTYNGNSINAIEIISNGTTPNHIGFWGIDVKDVSIAGGFKYAIYCDTGSAKGVATNDMWITDCNFDRITCSRVWCFLYMGTNNQGEGKGAAIGSGWIFKNCSMQSYTKDTNYQNSRFCILENAKGITFDRCIPWDFTIPCFQINYACSNIEINKCDNGGVDKDVVLTGENNGKLPYTYTQSYSAVTKGEHFNIPFKVGETATYAEAFSNVLEGYSEIQIGYEFFRWLGLDTALLRIGENSAMMLNKIVVYNKTMIRLWFYGDTNHYMWCAFDSTTKDSKIVWNYIQPYPTYYSNIPTNLSTADVYDKGKLIFIKKRLVNAYSRSRLADVNGRILIPLILNETELPSTEDFRDEDAGVSCYNNSTSMPVFYSNKLKKFLYADGSELKSWRVASTRTTRKIPLGTAIYDSTLEKIFIATKVTKNTDNEYYTIEWKDENGYSPTKKKGTTAERPTLDSTYEGFEYYDSTLKKKVLWNGIAWVNMDGSSLG